MVETYIDILFATLIVNCFSKISRSDHFSAINQILRYLANSQDRKIIFDGKLEL